MHGYIDSDNTMITKMINLFYLIHPEDRVPAKALTNYNGANRYVNNNKRVKTVNP